MRVLPMGSLLVAVVVNACRCPGPLEPITTRENVDTFTQKDAARVDVLWVVDNSGSMQAEQQKVAARFADFFRALVVSHVDYHIGVVSSDGAEHGVLRAYSGASVDGCNGCRFLTNAVPCANPDAALGSGECAAADVFANLVQTGTDGPAFEQLFAQAASALGTDGVNAPQPPAENAGFVRADASLYIVFVSDEDDPAATEVRYYQRLFEGMKGAGGENTVAVAGITGYPDTAPAPIDEACAVLGTTFDSVADNDDARAPDLEASLNAGDAAVCRDPEAPPDDASSGAKSGRRILELACRTGGVVASICSGDYSVALDALGADAAGLKRRFAPSVDLSQIEWGADCTPNTADDKNLDCDDDGHFDGALDGPLCVTAAGLPLAHEVAGCAPTGDPELVARSSTCGWELDDSGAVRFDGAFLPRPGSEVQIRYALTSTCGNNVVTVR